MIHIHKHNYSILKSIALLLALMPAQLHAQTTTTYNIDDINEQVVKVQPGTTIRLYDSGGPNRRYSDNENYVATFKSENGDPLVITITEFNTEPNYDFLYIFEGEQSTVRQGDELAKLSGNTIPRAYIIPTGSMVVLFESDNSNPWLSNYTGFCAEIRTLPITNAPEVTSCNATFTDDGGAGGNYNINKATKYVFHSADPSKDVRLDFSSFSLGGQDVLKIYDGPSDSSLLIGTYRNTENPGTVMSSGPVMSVYLFAGGAGGAGWVAQMSCFSSTTYYSYGHGNWNDPNSWTTDPSASVRVNPSNSYPQELDRAVIMNGHTIVASTNGNKVVTLELREGGTLDVSSTTGNDMGTISGKGTLRSIRATLPNGNYNRFVQSDGGTVVLYGNITDALNQPVLNNLVVEKTAVATTQITQNLLIRGTLNLNSGTLLSSFDNENGSITVEGNITVASGATFGVAGTPATLYASGDLMNRGTLNFTSKNAANYTTDATSYLTLCFNNPNRDQTFTLNGRAYLEKLIVSKGHDDTHTLYVRSNNSNNLNLYGRNNQDMKGEPPSIENQKALDIQSGTLYLGANISIPALLIEQGNIQAGNSFAIDQDAALVLDGAQVNLAPNGYTGRSSLIVYGRLRVTGASRLDVLGTQGIILREYGVVEIDGQATVNTYIVRTSSRTDQGEHRGTFLMNGGTLNILGAAGVTEQVFNSYSSFSLPFPDNTFHMSGGTINVNSPNDIGDSWLVSAKPNNIAVSGGTVNITTTNRGGGINSNAPFHHLNINGTGITELVAITQKIYGISGEIIVPAAPRRPLTVQGNLTVGSGASLNAQSMNVTVGGDFVLNGTYTPGQNSTIFNGRSLQTFDPSQGSITNGLGNMLVTNTSVLSVAANISVRDTLRIDGNALLKDMGHTLQHRGAVLHISGSHESEPNGSINMEGNGNQQIEGNGNGVLGNLTLNKPSGTTSLSANIRIDGNLRLAGAGSGTESVLNIGGHRLQLGSEAHIYSALTGTAQSFDSNRMVQTLGLSSDQGLSKEWSGTGTFVYPVGSLGQYTPAQLSINTAPTQWGSVAVAPVDGSHPLRTSTSSLKYYWNIRTDGISGLNIGSTRLNLYYQDAMVEGDENLYQPARYYPPEWTLYDVAQNPVTTLTNEIRFTQLGELHGQFTAAQPSACGQVLTYYSNVQNGEWNQSNSWTTDPAANTPATSVPSDHSPVVIRSGHTISISDGPKTSGSLSIQANAVLDLTTTKGHSFGMVNNSYGRLRISAASDTASFPSGDFGAFLSAGGGTVEYYTTGARSFVIPSMSNTSNKPVMDISAENGYSTNNRNWRNNSLLAMSWDTPNSMSYLTFSTPMNLSRASQAYVEIPIDRVSNARYITTFAVYASTNGNDLASFQKVSNITLSSGIKKIYLDDYLGSPEVYIAIVFQSTRGNQNTNCYIELSDFIKAYHIPGIPGGGGTISSNATRYNHLIINPSAALSIELPEEPLNVQGSLTVQGAGITHTSKAAATTLHVYGPTRIAEQGTLSIDNGNPFGLTLHDSLHVGPNATLTVASTGANTQHSIHLLGHAQNNGRLNLNNNGHYADLHFGGTNNQTFSGTGPMAQLYRVYVDKGSDQTAIADITANRFDLPTTLAQTLFIKNGTIRFTGASLSPTLSTGTFSIPSTGCLSVNGSAVAVCKSANNSADLLLAGRLEVLAGSMCVGDTLQQGNNDIEYAAATPSAISVEGGRLVVNGQIRRSVTNANGDLSYTQRGGRVYINGRSREPKRPLLEVLNDGHFEMHGGELLLVNGVGTSASTLGELLLTPATHNVTGGTIVVGTASTEANTNHFDLAMACPIFSLTVDGTGQSKHARLRTHEATLKGSLVVEGPASSQFIANGINLNIAGDLISRSSDTRYSFDYRPLTQRTTFNGLNQRIDKESANGYLLFGDVIVNLKPGGKLSHTGSSTILINGDLTLENGSLDQASGTLLEPRRNVYVRNGFTHTSQGSSVMLFYSTTSDQYIYSDGTGSLGRIQLYQHDVILEGNLRLNNGLNFSRINEGSSRKLIINEHHLTLGEAARIGAGVLGPNENRYIVTNGALSDAGVTKLFGAGSNTFTFPVGVGNAGGKYTPATLQVNNSLAGSITVTPVDAPHPGCTNATTDDQLQYYWRVSSSGLGTPSSVSHTYTYQQDDAQGNENEYIGARYLNGTYEWEAPVGTIDVAQNTITLSNVGYIDGEYTAGQPTNTANELNFGNTNIYFSQKTGLWEDASTWLVAHPSNINNRQPATKAPSGNPVFILTGHTVTTSQNWAYASSVDIAAGATLDLQRTLFHNLGHISGGGTMAITSNTSNSAEGGYFKFPGGDASQFMNTSGSLVRYTGNGVLPANIKNYMNVEFCGSGTKKHIPASDMFVYENLRITDGQLLAYPERKTIEIHGNWHDNVAGGFVPALSVVQFRGHENSTISAVNGETFNDLRIYKGNDAHVELLTPVEAIFRLYLTTGYVHSSETNPITVTNTNVAEGISGGNSSTFVRGPLRRLVNNGSSNVRFPVGDGSRYGELVVNNTSSTGAQIWTARYFDQQPNDDQNLQEPLEVLSDNEYWTLAGVNGTKANVQLRWDNKSGAIVQGDLDKLRIAQNLPPWTKVGDRVNASAQTVSTTTPIAFSGRAEELTLALEHTATARITNVSTNELCDDGTTIELNYTATGDAPLSITFHIDGALHTTVHNIGNGGTNTLHLSYAQLGSPGVHTVSIAEVRDRNNRRGIVQGSPASIETKTTPKPNIAGSNSVMTKSTTTYNVAPVSGDTYLWSIDALGSINGSNTEANVSIDWGSTMGTSVLTVVQTSPSGCSTTAQMTIEVRDWPIIAGSTTVCAGSTSSYSTKGIAGHSYSWHVEGGAITAGQGTANISVQWSSQTMGRITLRQGPAGSEQQIVQDITIAPLPVATIAAAIDTVCSGDIGQLLLGGQNLDPSYTLLLEQQTNGGAWATVGSYSSTGTVNVGQLEWTMPNPASHVNEVKFRLQVQNIDTGCQSGHAEGQIVVLKTPQTGPQYHIPNNTMTTP